MNDTQENNYSQSPTNFQPEHLREFQDSPIDSVTANNNFQSLDGNNENDRDELFTLLGLCFEANYDW
jgi:hypothetical protein